MFNKLKRLYLPYLVIISAFLSLYSFLNWFFIIRTNHYFFREEIVNAVIPGILAGIALLIWISPGLNLLQRTPKGARIRVVYQVVAWSAILIPTLFAQYYLQASLGQLTVLDNSAQLQQADISKYYQFRHYYVDKSSMSIYPSFHTSGRYNDKFNMSLYIALPIYADQYHARNAAVSAWLGKSWHKTIEHHPSAEEKERQFDLFVKKTLTELKNSDLDHPGYLERADHLYRFNSLQKAMEKSPKYLPGKSILFIAYDQPFAERAEGYKEHFILSFVLLGGLWLLLVICSKQDAAALTSYKKIAIKDSAFFRQIREAKDFPATALLLGINCLLFLLMFFKGLGLQFDADDLLVWGANFRPLTVEQHEWWRLLSSTFIHTGFIHLLPNMAALYFCGIFLEPLLGKVKYLAVYLATGIIASCASLWWHEAAISVGASGSLFGLFGILIALFVEKNSLTEFSERSAVLIPVVLFAAVGLLTGLVGFVDNAAHIGGLLCGLIIGLILRLTVMSRPRTEPI